MVRIPISIDPMGEGRWRVTVGVPGSTPHVLAGHAVNGRIVVTVDPAPPGDQTPERIAEILDGLEAHDYTAEDVAALSTHVFRCLLGPATWEKVREADFDLVELAIDSTDMAASRLPWELMRTDTGFVAAVDKPRVGITRLVHPIGQPAAALCNGSLSAIEIEPIVLFAIGAGLHDPQVRAGTEFLGIVRCLRERGLVIHQQILLDATPERLRDAVALHRPSILHFIGHGGVDPQDGQGYIELLPDDPWGSERARVKAEQLVTLLTSERHRPSVLVLAACATGAGAACYRSEQARWEFAPPLAAQCVRRGIPVAVGMGGEVADGVCRLFARRFYETLLQGGCLVRAITEGRRAGFELAVSPEASVDWAYPTLFLSSAVSSTVRLTGVDRIAKRDEVARFYAPDRRLTFCDRLEFFDHYRRLVRPPAAGARILAIEVNREDCEKGGPRYGKSWMLQELTGQAIRDGHLACLVDVPSNDDPPDGALALALLILQAARETWRQFGLDWPGRELQVPSLASGGPLCEEIKDALVLGGGDRSAPEVVAEALHLDLGMLGATWRQRTGGGLVVVLVDDVHRLGVTAAALVDHFVGPNGLTSSDDPVPLVFTYSSRRGEECRVALDAITTFVQQGTHSCIHAELGPFSPPTVHHLAYRQHLLGLPRPLVFKSGRNVQSDVNSILDVFHDNATRGGIPSLLTSRSWETLESAAVKLGILVPAKDDEVLRQLAESQTVVRA